MVQPPPHWRKLRELVASKFTYKSLCIQYPEEDVLFVFKTRLIHFVPKFHGLASEYLHKHLKQRSSEGMGWFEN